MQRLEENLVALHGKPAVLWLKALPNYLQKIATKHNLVIGKPFENLTFNYVAPVKNKQGSELVLKCGFDVPALRQEAAVLDAFSGNGMVSGEFADLDAGYLLLDRLLPGNTLALLPEDEAMEAVATLMLSLHAVEASLQDCPTMSDNVNYLEKQLMQSQQISKKLLNPAYGLLQDLLADKYPIQLIHGDLHHDNILQSQKQWCAIDPKGLMAEPMVELGALMRNPMSVLKAHPTPHRLIQWRLDFLSERLGYDRKRASAWVFVYAVLAACWTQEDGLDGLRVATDLAELFRQYLLG